MIGLDTNVLVRYLTQDDAKQFRQVISLLDREDRTFFLPDLVLVEAGWVLKKAYGWTSGEIAEAISKLLQVVNLVFEDEARVRGALDAVSKGADLADELIVGASRANSCEGLATFDKAVVKRHPQFAALPSDL